MSDQARTDVNSNEIVTACGLAEAISQFANQLDLFFGEANPAQARVYARLQLPERQIGANRAGLKLSGRLMGPQCEFAHTLPARISFSDCSFKATLLVEAVVPDPCFWTPELPFVYRAALELHAGESIVGSCQKLLGIRRLGVRGQSLYFDGQRFVLRAVDCRSQNADCKFQIEKCAEFARESWTALIVAEPDDKLCQFASRRGVLLVADLTTTNDSGSAEATIQNLRRLAQWPAVGIALLRGQQSLPVDFRNDVRNLLLAQLISNDGPLTIAPWANLLFVEVDDIAQFAQKILGCDIPVVAIRRAKESTFIEQSRTNCDRLQSDLAQICDFAGYVV